MNSKVVFAFVVVLVIGLAFAAWRPAEAGTMPSSSDYKVLEPIRHGSLTVFPVVAAKSYNTAEFLTLDEGLRSGEVLVTESGGLRPLMRRRMHPVPVDGAQVNRLVLVNNSKRPLILLAGEIVTGGKQDRVVGKDRIVPPKSDPIDLSVFCVEPGRWVETASHFKSLGAPVAQPSVRKEVMAGKDQQKVWDEVLKSKASILAAAPAPAQPALEAASSYADVIGNQEVKRQLDSAVAPIERSYENLIRELRAQNAVGVVVAVNGEIVWADVFASTALLEKYWSKLVRSYAAEALTSRASHYPDLKWR